MKVPSLGAADTMTECNVHELPMYKLVTSYLAVTANFSHAFKKCPIKTFLFSRHNLEICLRNKHKSASAGSNGETRVEPGR